ncbi:tyrosine-type recombinase/integrase [Pseudobacteroides cellulosolvens]|uniref:Integrase family protein n=1 Tax=Pseudobacteroides cellulosolvens ATCC 35603 = DSM 2933 TaxID=398512 RepID=A0A0L6JLP8_9FIRM|nr:site-specific integrase [Pseudobacteroides cellulosolvens]KNY26307.1 integrase family protein [Pseudobacteroides cellulosolvens ATCC 35603 = DSM 2933]
MNKRNNNTGSITYHKPSGKYMGRVNVGRDINGKMIRKCVYGNTEGEVAKEMIKLQAQVYDEVYYEPSRMLLKQWLNQWLNTYKITSLKQQTLELYRTLIDTIINPKIGDNKLKDIKPIHIQDFINKLYNFGEGYSTSTLQKIKNILNPAFKLAIKNKLINENPCDGLQLPRPKQKQVEAFTREEQNRFETKAKESSFYELFIFALDTGARSGEILALNWNDIDLKKGEVKISKTVISVKDKVKEKLVVKVQDTPKTQSANRLIPLTNRCIDLLKEMKKKRFQKGFDDHNIVFCSKAGTYMFPKNLRRSMDIVCNKANINKSGMHVFRHSFVTRLFEENVPIKVISSLIGHNKIETTLNIYTHLTQDNKVDAIKVLNNLVLAK